MFSESEYLYQNLRQMKELQADIEIPDINGYEINMEEVKQYLDEEGVLHVKTVFGTSDIKDTEVWEVFDMANGSSPLELLLDI